MNRPDNGYPFEENAELAKQAVNRLNVTKTALEYLFTRDEYDLDEMKYCFAIERSWHLLSTSQKKVLYMHILQGFNFTTIAELQGYTPQNAYQLFNKACKTIQKNI